MIDKRKKEIALDISLAVAESVQSTLFLHHRPPSGIDLAVHHKPAERIGGDWHSFVHEEFTNAMIFFCGDVTGHGIGSALVTGLVAGVIQTELNRINRLCASESDLDWPKALGHMLSTANNILYDSAGKSERGGMTLTVLCLLPDGTLHFLNAAHPFPLLIRAGKIKQIAHPGYNLGAQRTRPEDWTCQTLRLSPGDTIMLYSDGLVENEGLNAKRLELRNLKKALVAPNLDSCQDYLNLVLDLGKAVWQDNEPEDDCTILIFSWKRQRSQAAA